MRVSIAGSSVVCALLVAVACGDSPGGDAGTASTGTPAGSGAGNVASSGAGGNSTTSSSGSGGAGQPSAAALYTDAIHTIALEIDYMPGAEPYTGAVAGFGELWDIAQANIEALFDVGKTVIIPRELQDMEQLSGVSGDSFGYDEIQAIADQHRDLAPLEDGVASLYVVWVDGYYLQDGQQNTGVLGVSFGDTGLIAMFKPVIAGTSLGPALSVEKYVEQVTLVHELGHAAGLVNNGVAMVADHQDTEHGRHCTNQDCIMYWTIAGTQGALDFVQKSVTSPGAVLWGAECLADTDAAQP